MTLKDELIEAIRNEQNFFGMGQWVRGPLESQGNVASCHTASCMAGHIEALRPELARSLLRRFHYASMDYGLDHSGLASHIWHIEMGEACPLDFCGYNNDMDLEDITRADAIAHIQGLNKSWPQNQGHCGVDNAS
jgi:hypothetical protein